MDVVSSTPVQKGGTTEIEDIAIIDDGHGMEPEMIRAAVLWGGTHRRNDRSGFGRFGFGLPSAAVSIARRFQVYSKLKGGNWHRVAVDLDQIVLGKHTTDDGMVIAPLPENAELPRFVQDALEGRVLESGTVILLSEPDRLTSGYRKPTGFHNHLMEHLGLIYRGVLGTTKMFVNGKLVTPVDPLFLDPNARYYDVKNGVLAQGREPIQFDVKTRDGRTASVRLRISFMPDGFQNGPVKKENERLPIMKSNNAYLIVTRAGRQIDLVTRTDYQKESSNTTVVTYDRNWAIELDFDPALDEEFGITVNKQQVTLSEKLWEVLESQGIPQIIVKDLRQAFKKSKGDRETKDAKSSTSKTSTEIMKEADKFQSKKPPVSEEKQKEARQKVMADVEKTAQETNQPKEKVAEEKLAELNEQKYDVTFEALEGAPFYRVELYGPQKRVFLNTRHRFYTDVYAGPGATPRLKSALELLLMVLGSSELDSDGDQEIWYRLERKKWSDGLEVRLQLLDRRDSVEDAAAANESAEELALGVN